MKNMIEDIVTTKDKTLVKKKIRDIKKKVGAQPELKEKLKAQFKKALAERGKQIEQLEKEISIKLQLQEVTEIVSMSYIAETYFGQKKAWIYQRINGNKVNGKVVSFTEDQKKKLNAALKDISKKIAAVKVS